MIIIQLMGGLGNQLQQYAFYRKLCQCGIDACIDVSWYESTNQEKVAAKRSVEIDRLGGVSYVTASKKDSDSLTGGDGFLGKVRRRLLPGSVSIFEENSRIYVEDMAKGIFEDRSIKDMYMRGFFACEKYYADILPLLRSELVFPVEECTCKKALEELSVKIRSRNAVSVHLRRGDYLDDANRAVYGNICTDAYYDTCIDYMVSVVERPVFYIFSDDADYAAEFAGKINEKYKEAKAVVVDINHGSDSMFDIYLMSLCKHNITANSTFSFWGARLNGYENKITIRPTIHINSQSFDEKLMKDRWKGWCFASPDGVLYK